MALPQGREGNFNPASPHSSSGVADSFKGTPDTRLTAFSPEDGSARSAKATGSLTLVSHDIAQSSHPVSSPGSRGLSKYYHRNLQLERDPFVTSSDPSGKTAQRLSPTASSFFPLHTQLATHVPISEFDTRGKPRESALFYLPPSTHTPTGEDQNPGYVHPLLSTDTGLSRCLIVSRLGGGALGETEVKNYITVGISNAVDSDEYLRSYRTSRKVVPLVLVAEMSSPVETRSVSASATSERHALSFQGQE